MHNELSEYTVYFTLTLCHEILYLLGRRDAAEGARVEEGARGAGLQSGQVVHADDVEVGLTLQEKDSCGSERKGGGGHS